MNKNKKSRRWIFLVLLAILTLIALIILGYQLEFTGFSWTRVPKSDKYEYIPGKTLWDWLNLLIVPSVLAIIAILFNRAEKHSEERRASDQQKETALQSYLNNMTELMLDKGLVAEGEDESKNGDETINSKNYKSLLSIARARTLTVLRGLDGDRKRQVLQFLLEAELIGKRKKRSPFRNSIIDLSGADLSNARLTSLNLEGLYLSDVNLQNSDFSHTNLKNIRLAGSSKFDQKWELVSNLVNNDGFFIQRNLRNSDLTNANLENVDFGEADLSGADLTGALLKHAWFRNVSLSSRTKIESKYRAAWQIYNEEKKPKESRKLDFEGADLSDVRLSFANLSYTTLKKVNFENALLDSAILTEADLRETKLTNVSFHDADIHNSNFEGAHIFNADFTRANLNEANFSGTRFFWFCKFDNANLVRSNLSASEADNASFIHADLSATDMSLAKMKDCNFTGANLSQTDLSYADLSKSDLSNANLEGAILNYVNLKDTVFNEQTKVEEKWRRANLLLSNLPENRDFSGWELSNCYLNGASLESSDFSNANLMGSILTNGVLKNSKFQNTNLQNVDFSYALLHDTDFRGAKLDFAKLKNAIVNTETLLDQKAWLVWLVVNDMIVNTEEVVDLTERDLSSAFLEDCKLFGINLENANFQNSVLRHANFKNAILRGANFENADLHGANFSGADLKGANLKGVNLAGVQYLKAYIDTSTEMDDKWRHIWELVNSLDEKKCFAGEDLSDVNFSGLKFYFADFSGANLSRSQLTYTHFGGCKFQEANFSKANLNNVVFIKCNMRNTSFDEANIYWSSFRGSWFLGKSQIKKANTVEGVKMPNGRKLSK